MWEALIWLYIINATLLIVHEMDSAYWKEWDLFRLPGGPGGFMVIHLPLVALILWGLLELAGQAGAGLILSMVLALGGIFAFCIHSWFLKKGRPEFRSGVSIFILLATLAASLVQGGLVIYAWGA